MDSDKKKFRMFDVILTVICVVFVAEAAAPVAAIGNQQFFWWILLIVAFLLPYGLIAVELGTTYEGQGGMYDWVKRAFGNRMASRTAWYYWLNFPLWMASLAVMIPQILQIITGTSIPTLPTIIIELAFIWIVVFISFYPVSDSVWILNGAAVLKMLLALTLGGLGIYGAMTHGVANAFTVRSFLPTLDMKSISLISVIIFNMLGFEVVCTFTDSMENPKKQIPQAIIIGGIVIAAIYIFSSFGISAAIPTSQISTSSGMIDALQILTGQKTGMFIGVMAFIFMLTLFGNMISWSLGVNNVVQYAAEDGNMPKVFIGKSKKNGMPIGVSIMNGIVATVVVVIAPFIPNQDLFWSFFALNLVMFLSSYIPMFPAFLKLRKIDSDKERPFKVGGSNFVIKLAAYAPMTIAIIAIILTAIPLSADDIGSKLPITIGAIIGYVVEEIFIRVKKIKNEELVKQNQ
ncbi:APC family permease [Clostridium coskatii]|uniref:Glutamate/gamma-aminobutyrate antiporter n=1 Tax=Clostridium coskatii TaxID=1705578 RepID=A0A166T2A0_9CLOT|nr:APC family permease [Clostridium coskatii]OAA93108.1 Glutamate/gamma-aminobutyrate antiporter [Clostridium coskatii]OBR90851.1 glutamate/gamma-aminobutyrate antiporter [Clostridium coskatii]